MPKQRTAWVLAALAALTLCACANVLGIESAQHDEKLDPGVATNQPKTLCEQYCDTVMANCTGATPVYRSRAMCDAVCAALPPGKPGDTTGNTIQCRLHYAGLVPTAGEEATYCPIAGPGGDGTCGENCDGFCAIADVACAGAIAAVSVVGAPCQGVCQALPDLGPSTFTSNIDTGNSIECRLYHVSAATVDPQTHCKHVAGIAACLAPKP